MAKTIVIRLADGDLEYTTDTIEQTSLRELRAFVRRERGGTTLNRRLKFIYNGHVLTPSSDIAREVMGTRDRVYVICAVGTLLTSVEIARGSEGDDTQQVRQSTEPESRGFDRLLNLGFSNEEVTALRNQFGELYGTNNENQPELEEEWIESGTESSSSHTEELLAILVGSFVGVFFIVIMQLNVLSRRQARALLVGVFINLAFTLVQLVA